VFNRETVNEFNFSYYGEFESEIEFAEYLYRNNRWDVALEDAGINARYFDMQQFANDLFADDYYYHCGGVYRR
jgi:antirestriction protein